MIAVSFFLNSFVLMQVLQVTRFVSLVVLGKFLKLICQFPQAVNSVRCGTKYQWHFLVRCVVI